MPVPPFAMVRALPSVSDVSVALVAKRFVVEATIAKKLVVVALVEVALVEIRSVSVVEPYTPSPPRVKMPERPTLSPPPTNTLLPTLRSSLTLKRLVSIAPIVAAGASIPFMSTIARPLESPEMYAYLPDTKTPFGWLPTAYVPTSRGLAMFDISTCARPPVVRVWSAR